MFLKTTARSVFLLATLVASAWARPGDDARVQRFRTEVISTHCRQILEGVPAPRFYAVEGALGLSLWEGTAGQGSLSLDEIWDRWRHRDGDFVFGEHELLSSLHYARYLNQAYGERVVFLPAMEGQSVPGFDGLILGPRGRPIANFSIKTLMEGSTVRDFDRAVGQGIDKAIHYGQFDAWADFASQIGGQIWGDPEHVRRQLRHLERASHFLNSAARVFDIPVDGVTRRPNRLVIDAREFKELSRAAQVARIRKALDRSPEYRGGVDLITVDGTVIEID